MARLTLDSDTLKRHVASHDRCGEKIAETSSPPTPSHQNRSLDQVSSTNISGAVNYDLPAVPSWGLDFLAETSLTGNHTSDLALPSAAFSDHLEWLDPVNYELPETFNLQGLDQFNSTPMWPLQTLQDLPAQMIDTIPPPSQSVPQNETEASRGSSPKPQIRWFDRIDTPTNQESSSLQTGLRDTTLGNSDRLMIEQRLKQFPSSDVVPSTTFLNRCLRLYIDKVLPLLPIIHLPTFRPSQTNALLLVTISALGSQLIGTQDAALRGHDLYERMHSAVLASWMSIIDGSQDRLAVLQAVVLGRVFAMLSSRRKHLVAAQAFHGALIHSYRTCKRQHSNGAKPVQTSWSEWIKDQELHRLENAIRILDVELSLLCHQAPLMSHLLEEGIDMKDSDKEFFAPDAESWKRARTANKGSGHQTPSEHNAATSTLSIHAQLSSIISAVCDSDFGRIDSASRTNTERQLIQWLSTNSILLSGPVIRGLHLQSLWHSGWLGMLCDFEGIEIACGKDSDIAASSAKERMVAWSSTTDAQRALVHAFKIYQLLVDLSVSDVPALHIPRVAFQAGLIFHALSTFSPGNTTIFVESHEKLASSPDMQILAKQGLLKPKDWELLRQSFNSPIQLKSQACILVGLLRRTGTWGISQNLAQTLEDLVS